MSQNSLGPVASAVLLATQLSIWGCTVPLPQSGPPTPMQMGPRQLIVTLSADKSARWDEIASGLSGDYEIEKMSSFPLTSIDVQCVVFGVPSGQPLAVVVTQLVTDSRVETVQRNQLFQSAAYSDPHASLQHGAETINASAAHSLSTGKGVKVAIVDTGVDRNHPDLAGRVVDSANFVQGGAKSFDRDWHGTAVAGIIAARADNEEGIFGIAPEAELYAAKACRPVGTNSVKAVCSSWTIAQSIDYAIRSGARIVNLSLAHPYYDALIARLLNVAHKRGIVAVAAVADARLPEQSFPAALDSVIAVTASGVQGQIEEPERQTSVRVLAAPGAEIMTTLPDGQYDFLSGSSMATAHVSGAIALILERQPELAPSDVLTLLHTSGQAPLPRPNSIANPISTRLLDAYAAVERSKEATAVTRR